MSTTRELREGQHLINPEAERVFDIDAVDDDVVTLTGESKFHNGDYDLGQIHDALGDGFELFDGEDHPLTNLKGVGPRTAAEIYGQTGCETPEEVMVAYLTDCGEEIEDAVRRVDYLHDAIRESDVTVTKDGYDVTKVMLFIRVVGANSRGGGFHDVPSSKYHGNVKQLEVTPDHLDLSEKRIWTDASSVAAIALSRDDLIGTGVNGSDLDEYVPATSMERDGAYYRVGGNGGEEVWIDRRQLEEMDEVFERNLTEPDALHYHPGSKFPVVIEDTDVWGMIARKVR